MIYFGPLLRKKAPPPIMHYALNPSGYLMLGRSESIGEFANLFSLVDKNSRIYSKEHHRQYCTSTGSGSCSGKADEKKKVEEHATGGTDIQKEADSIILNRYKSRGTGH